MRHHEPVIGGLQSFSTVDWPGKLAATVFLQGCPMRCTYCHNPQLQDREGCPACEWSDVLTLLDRRSGILDGVVFSGGEPLMSDIVPWASDVKSRGMLVGIHTTGVYPSRLSTMIDKGLVDWAGLDVKTSDAGVFKWPHFRVKQSLDLLYLRDIDFEVRCTVTPGCLDEAASISSSVHQEYGILPVMQKARGVGWSAAQSERFLNLPGAKR